jgi:hypothetical protein
VQAIIKEKKMRGSKKIVFGLLVLPVLISARYIDSYQARLGEVDHFNSSGHRLNSAAAIIRQDRYNFLVRNISQNGDTWDEVFHNKARRSRMERMLNNGFISNSARRRIVNGTPLIKVDIFSDHINVKVLH